MGAGAKSVAAVGPVFAVTTVVRVSACRRRSGVIGHPAGYRTVAKPVGASAGRARQFATSGVLQEEAE